MTTPTTSTDTIEFGSRCSRGYNSARHKGVESKATKMVTAKEALHYKDSLKAWGGTWMWEMQSLSEDLSWVAGAI